jgi:drug/metabolite transporter (DMT)-like permease
MIPRFGGIETTMRLQRRDDEPMAPAPEPAAAAPGIETPLLGILCSLVANVMFASSDALVKGLTASYSIFQIIPMQVAFACIPILVMLRRDGGFRRMRAAHPRLIVLRGFLAGIGTIFGFYAFSALPLADVYAIAFCTPMVVTILSIPILGEQVRIHRWAAVVVGFLGILVMVRPGFEALTLGHLSALGSVFTGAGVVLIMRKISRDEQRAVLVTAVMLGLLATSLPIALFVFKLPAWFDVLRVGAAGLFMGSAQFLVVRALSLAPASTIAPMQYTMIVWALAYGSLFFGNVVDPFVVAGATIVIASSLYIMHRERRRGRTLRAHVK